MLSAKGEVFDKVLGLELGADDYMEKPFDSKELVARVKAVLRQALNMNIHGAGVSHIFITPDLVQQLLSGKYMIGGGSQKIQKFQFFWRHIHASAHIGYGVIGAVDGEVGIFHLRN